MTLDEFMAAADEKDIYHIGSKDGFVMVVRPDEYKDAVAEANKKAKETMMKLYKEHIGTMLAATTATKLFGDNKITIQLVFTKDIEASNKAKEKAERKLLNIAEKMIEYVPMETREVQDVYERIGGGFVVIIDGNEHGAYWDRQEWEKRHDKH